jgi:hypothetical protein
VLWIVLPLAARSRSVSDVGSIAAPINVGDVVFVEVVLVVYVDVAATVPVTIAPGAPSPST